MKPAITLMLLGMLAGCAVSPPDNTVNYRPGIGVVEAVQPARVALPRSGGGAIAGSRWTNGYQLTLKMDDGTSQKIAQDSVAFAAGDRIQITPEGRIARIVAVAPPSPVASATPAPSASPAEAYRPGVGIVESATVGSLSASTSSAAGGASGPTMAYRLKMLDGTTQHVVQVGPRFHVGDRVQLTREGRIVRP